MQFSTRQCAPCEGGVAPLRTEQIQEYLSELKPGWEAVLGKKIKKEFAFRGFREAMVFVNDVAELARQENHHPDIHIIYSRALIELTTHAIKGLSENDFIMAAKIDMLI